MAIDPRIPMMGTPSNDIYATNAMLQDTAYKKSATEANQVNTQAQQIENLGSSAKVVNRLMTGVYSIKDPNTRKYLYENQVLPVLRKLTDNGGNNVWDADDDAAFDVTNDDHLKALIQATQPFIPDTSAAQAHRPSKLGLYQEEMSRLAPNDPMREVYQRAMEREAAGDPQNAQQPTSPYKYVRPDEDGNMVGYNIYTNKWERMAADEGIRVGTGGVQITTGPDGTVTTSIGGAARNQVTEDVVKSGIQISDLEDLKQVYQRDFLTVGGKLQTWGLKVVDWFGGDLSEGQKKYLQKRRDFSQRSERFFQEAKNILTGAAASGKEMDNLRDAVLSADLGPTEWEGAWKSAYELATRTFRIKQDLLANGLKVGTSQFKEQMARRVDPGLNKGIEERGDELQAQGLSDEDVLIRLKEEGYR